ncbi:hypothetical protein [Crassaminicella profunda]|nr:hypothetical protein [Crassaminicella profunda]QZY56354.1 hypothetical protein K7H06_05235 [Crassaminicella profunda]
MNKNQKLIKDKDKSVIKQVNSKNEEEFEKEIEELYMKHITSGNLMT